MGSDLFESYVGSIISAITLAAVAVANKVDGATFNEETAALFPLLIAAIGILASVIGIMCVRGKDDSDPAKALNLGTYISGVIVIIATIILSKTMLGSLNYAWAIIAGLIVGVLALVFHNMVVSKISNVVYMLEIRTTEFMDLLHENA